MNNEFNIIIQKLDSMDSKIDRLDGRVERLEADVAELKTDVAELKTDVAELKTDVAKLKTDVAKLKDDVADLQIRMSSVERSIRRIDLTLENNICKEIRAVADGHLDLYRRLQAAEQVKDQREHFIVRMELMEGDLRYIKEQISQA